MKPMWVALIAVAVLALGLLTVDPARAQVARILDPPTFADQAAVGAQRTAAEQALARGYAKAVDQLRSTSGVKLPVSAAQAAAIQQKAVADLVAVRRAALADVAHAVGLTGTAAIAYISAIEPKLDEATAHASEPPVLLAPGLFAIVSRANALFSQVADQATRELTTAPATPSPTRRP